MNVTKLPARTYSAAEAAAVLGVGKSTICRAVREGRAAHLRPIRVGQTLRFPMAHIDNLVSGGAA